MDTIQVSIILNKDRLKDISLNQMQELRTFICGIYGRRSQILKNGDNEGKELYYCDCLEISKIGNLIVKISYPRFYEISNAHLVLSHSQCIEVQAHFCVQLMGHELLHDAKIKLDRVDIPFTFYMDERYDFSSYKKVYQILDYVYRKKNFNIVPKAFTDIEKFKAETLIYSDSASISGSNKKVMIYNQYKNIKTKTKDQDILDKILIEYTDLPNRMRIEVSKRIKRKEFTILEFGVFSISNEYLENYKKYIYDNLLDINEIENFYDEKSKDLADKLNQIREKGKINYETFIYKEIENIYDNEIVKRAIRICMEKEGIKTREKAITTINKILYEYQSNQKMIIIETKKIIEKIRRSVDWYFLR